MFQNRLHPSKNLPIMILIIIIPIIFAPIILHMIANRGADYQSQIVHAMELDDGTGPLMPHPLFHILIILIHKLIPGISFPLTGLLYAIIMYIFVGVVIYSIYIRPVFGKQISWVVMLVAIFTTLTIMTLSAVTILTWDQHNLYWGYIVPNAYHSPPLLTMRPFTLILFVYVVGAFSPLPYFKTRSALIIAAMMIVLTSLSKPNYTIAVLPVLGLITLYRLWKKQDINWPLLLSIIVPAVLILGVQLLILPSWTRALDPPYEGGIAFAPFALLDALNVRGGFLLKFVMSILYPLVVYTLYFKKAKADFALNIAWLIFAVGTFYTYCIIEPQRITDGNFVWSGQITLFMLFVISAVFFLRQIYEPGKGFKINRAAVVCGVIWLLHVASGVLWYATEISSVAVAERWW